MVEYRITMDNHNLILEGDMEELKKFRYVYSFINKEMASTFSKTTITIKVDDVKEDLLRLKRIFDRFKIELIFQETADDEFNLIKNEQEKFNAFSVKAMNIRNNICDIDDFTKFIKTINSILVNRRLYPLQLLSAYHMAFSQNACNFSVPGAGKTSIVYAAYGYLNSLHASDPKKVNHIIVIGPLSSFGPWENEYLECFGKKPDVQRLSSSMNVDKNSFFATDQETELILLSYQGILSCVDRIIDYLKRTDTLLVLDEAHKIKNIEDGKAAEAVLKLAPYAKGRIVLTGTPVPNGYQDLFNIFKFIWPTKNVIGFHSYQLKDLSKNPREDVIEQLINNIEPYFIRIKKSDMGNMPIPIEVTPIIVDMDPVQRFVYDSIEKKLIQDFMDDEESFLSNLKKAKLIRLMQVASNVKLLMKPILENDFIDVGIESEIDSEVYEAIVKYNLIPPKFKAALNVFKEVEARGEKLIIWCTFVDNILGLSQYLTENRIYNKVLYGGIPSKSSENELEDTRESILKEFHNNERLKVVIANPHAVGESISIHKVCHNALYLERTFNATHFLQSKDRIHRYGLEENDEIRYYYLFSRESIDEVIHERLLVKKKMMEDVIDKYPIPLFDNLSDETGNEDIRSVVKAYVRRNQNKI
ncbi:MAG: helicase SNF2 [Firmicutes bacterium HGW-Firmicutes-5]|nr:MAG: helicase SNF2 [Firmicutes bacterium HGW-Firmicutes-5]